MSSPNLFFFRDEVEYTNEEMINRIHVRDFRAEDRPEVKSILDEAGLDREVLDNRKEVFLDQIKKNVPTKKFRDFLEGFFEKFGEKGETVNLQTYVVEELDRRKFLSEAEERLQKPITGNEEHTLGLLSEIRQVDDNVIDIRVEKSVRPEELDEEEINVVYEDERVPISSVMDKDAERIEREIEFTIEARFNFETDLVFFSNAKVNDRDRNALKEELTDWADYKKEVPKFILKETELLLIQNLMKGDNSGLDYGEFYDENLNVAKYRGSRQHTLYRSPILTPAREQGKITQVRYYTEYENNGMSTPIQVRVYEDGHFTTSKPVEDDFAETIGEYIGQIVEYREYFTPIGEVMREFIDDYIATEYGKSRGTFKSRIITSFGSIIDDNIPEERYEVEEAQIYESIIINTGIELAKCDLQSSKYPDLDPLESRTEELDRIKDFFDAYFQYGEVATTTDFSVLWPHLMNAVQREHDNPLDLIQKIEEKYDL